MNLENWQKIRDAVEYETFGKLNFTCFEKNEQPSCVGGIIEFFAKEDGFEGQMCKWLGVNQSQYNELIFCFSKPTMYKGRTWFDIVINWKDIIKEDVLKALDNLKEFGECDWKEISEQKRKV